MMRAELTPEAGATLERLSGAEAMLEALRRALGLETALAAGAVVERRLTGQGPYPVAEHRLGERTHLLRNSLRATEATRSGTQVGASIGSHVVYAGAHEFGAVIQIPARRGTARLRLGQDGRLARQAGHGNLAVFARTGERRAREVDFAAAARTVVIPARAPVGTEIAERLPAIAAALGRALTAAWEG